jgi:hypothetical protein
MEYLALCSKVLYDRDILEKQNEIVDLKKRLYCSHGKPPLHIYYHMCSSRRITIGEYSHDNKTENNCFRVVHNISEQIATLFCFNVGDPVKHIEILKEAIDNNIPDIFENYIYFDSHYGLTHFISSQFGIMLDNFKKIIKGDSSFKTQLTEIIYSNLLKLSNLPKHSKEKTDEVIEYIYEIYPMIYEEMYAPNFIEWINILSDYKRFENILEKLDNFICYKIFGVYYMDLLYYNDKELIPKLSKKFELIHHPLQYDDSDKIVTLCVDCKKRYDILKKKVMLERNKLEEYIISERNKRKKKE